MVWTALPTSGMAGTTGSSEENAAAEAAFGLVCE
jgi:hypothetical protein